MNSMNQIDDDKRRKNIRMAWILAGFVLLIMISSIPFWKGMIDFLAAQG